MDERSGGPEPSFQERLRAARKRHGLDPVVTNEPEAFSPWGIGLRVGSELVSSLLVAVGIGWLLDRWLGTRPILLGVFVLLGGAAGVLNVWRLFAPPSPPGGKRPK
jgi:ATP synthase protein I